MVELTHTIADPMGFHARSVMLVAGEAGRWNSTLSVSFAGRTAKAEDPIELMGLGAKVGDTIVVSIEGDDEQDCAEFVNHLLRRL